MPGATPSPVTISALLIVVTIFHALAVILTSFRLWFRYRTQRLWWDDFWAALTLLCNAVSMVIVWFAFAPLDDPYTNSEALPTPVQSHAVHVMAAWLGPLLYTCAIWFARVSIMCSVVRIVPPTGWSGTAAILSGILFLCLWFYMMLCKIVACAIYDDGTILRCAIPEWVAISEVCTDVLSDLIIVVLPLCLLWRVRLPSKQRIMIISIFSSSIFVSIVSVVHTLYIIPVVTDIGPLTAELGSAVSLIVCNLLVVVTFVYRVMRNDVEFNALAKQTSSSQRLTTVDLDYHGTWFSERVECTNTANTNVSSIVFAKQDREASAGTVVEEECFPLGTICMKK